MATYTCTRFCKLQERNSLLLTIILYCTMSPWLWCFTTAIEHKRYTTHDIKGHHTSTSWTCMRWNFITCNSFGAQGSIVCFIWYNSSIALHCRSHQVWTVPHMIPVDYYYTDATVCTNHWWLQAISSLNYCMGHVWFPPSEEPAKWNSRTKSQGVGNPW